MGGKSEFVQKLTQALVDKAAPAAPRQPLRLYHGTKKTVPERSTSMWLPEGRSFPVSQGFDELNPDMSTHELGLHLGTPKQASHFAGHKFDYQDPEVEYTPGYLADNAPVNGRVVPLDVDIQRPLRLQDNTGNWSPHNVYAQIADLGEVNYDANFFAGLKQAEAMRKVRNLIEGLGYDGVVYKNRYETGVPSSTQTQRLRGVEKDVGEMGEEEFSAMFPEAEDSYIVWDRDKYRSPFGEGTGVGFEDGGYVDGIAPENYEDEVAPFLEYYTSPEEMAAVPEDRHGDYLVQMMGQAGKIAAEGQPTDDRGELNWNRRRQRLVRSLMGADEDGYRSEYQGPMTYNPSEAADFVNTMIDFSPVSLAEVAHDTPYEAGRTGDWSGAAQDGALSAAMTHPGMKLIGKTLKGAYGAVKRHPKTVGALAGGLSMLGSARFANSDDEQE